MIYIFCALYQEAAPFLREYGLKKSNTSNILDIFENAEENIRLIITGPGQVKAAMAVGITFTKYTPQGEDLLINIGICAGNKVGQTILVNKLTNISSKRVFYPDMIIKSDITEGELFTCSRSVECVDMNGFYDMEAAAIYEAATSFLGPHQMSFIKIVSDSGTKEKINPREIEQLLSDNLKSCIDYINSAKKYLLQVSQTNKYEDEIDALVEKLSREMCCSVTMKNQLKQYVTYGILEGVDFNALADKFYEEGILPCENRKAGKAALDEFTGKLL